MIEHVGQLIGIVAGEGQGRAHFQHVGMWANTGLKKSSPANLRSSILQLTAPDLDPAAIIAIEASWKKRLHSRGVGLSRN